MEYLYYFRNLCLDTVYKTRAVDSDEALLKCLQDTKWLMEAIIYEGKTIAPQAPPNILETPLSDN